MPPWHEWLGRVAHVTLYVVILGMVPSGIGMIVLGGAGPAILEGEGATLPVRSCRVRPPLSQDKNGAG